jgi:putative ABC transport system permease protein
VELIEEGRGDLVVGIPVYIGDEDYLETLGVELLMGHSFPKQLDRKNQQIILNEEALRAVGWQGRKAEDIIGKAIDVNGLRYELAGIVDNYHFESLHKRVGPIAILSHYYQGYENLMLRIKPDGYKEAILRIGALTGSFCVFGGAQDKRNWCPKSTWRIRNEHHVFAHKKYCQADHGGFLNCFSVGMVSN